MNRLFSFVLLFALVGWFNTTTTAQIMTPSASPSSTVKQTVGLTDFIIEYSRPSKKDRDIFAADGLVRFGDIWRTGANTATKFSTSDDIMINGKKLAAGDYTVLTIPNANEWKFHFYPYESGSWSSYVEKEPYLITSSVPQTEDMTMMESFLITFDELRNTSAKLWFIWDNVAVPLNVQVMVDDRVMKNIETTLAGPTKNDYYAAASYYHDSGKDLNKALDWINKATEGDDARFWQVRKKALILADMGKKKEAIDAARESMKLAKAAGNDEYVRMNQESINEWMK